MTREEARKKVQEPQSIYHFQTECKLDKKASTVWYHRMWVKSADTGREFKDEFVTTFQESLEEDSKDAGEAFVELFRRLSNAITWDSLGYSTIYDEETDDEHD